MVQNRKKHRKNSHLIIHCPTSEGVSEVSEGVSEVSERASNRVSAAEGASKASSPEQANEWAVRANKRTDERVAQYLRPDFWLLSTIVKRRNTGWRHLPHRHYHLYFYDRRIQNDTFWRSWSSIVVADSKMSNAITNDLSSSERRCEKKRIVLEEVWLVSGRNATGFIWIKKRNQYKCLGNEQQTVKTQDHSSVFTC